MPERETMERVKHDRTEGKAPSTQAGEFIREEMRHIREGKHGARSSRQAVAIGLSKARRAGVALPPPKNGNQQIRRKASRDLARGRHGASRPSRARSRGVLRALRREGTSAASSASLGRQARASARRRGAASRSAAARKAARTRSRQRNR